MMLLLLLVLVPVQVLMNLPGQRAQTLDFLVSDIPCNPMEQSKPDKNRNPYCLPGCSMQMVCKYRNESEDFCSLRNTTHLRVYRISTARMENSIVIRDRTKCSLTVEFRNMTTDFQGQYRCEDTLSNSTGRDRNIKVGEAPVAPMDVRLEFRPRGSISVLLNPVKTGLDLNDKTTTWTVHYNWSTSEGYKRCRGGRLSDKRCKRLRPDGLCQPCFIKLRKYDGCGQYSNDGYIGNQIRFDISIKNIFGENRTSYDFFLPDWVKPGPVNSIRPIHKGSSWLSVKVTAPQYFDLAHFDSITNKNNALALEYTVDLLPPEKQSLFHNEDKQFYEMYHFVRNLEDNEAALNQTLVSAFPRFFGPFQWSSSPQETCVGKRNISSSPKKLNITDLPFPGYVYNITVRPIAHYRGDADFLQVQTGDTAPKEEPQLHDNFAYCPIPAGKTCAVCVIYFKEIPQSRRGGVILEHVLTVTPLNNDELPAPASCRPEDKVVVGGQNNTFLVQNLSPDGVYNVSLQAHNSKGPSPATWKILRVRSSPSPTSPTNVIVERSGSAYSLWWNGGLGRKVMTFVHMCYTIPLQLQGPGDANRNQSSEAAEPLNCVTNMVTKRLEANMTAPFTFDKVHSNTGLTPAFFVSTVMPDDHTQNSGLLSADCFYAGGFVPEPVDSSTINIQPLEQDSSALVVKFSLPCGKYLNYEHGRPHQYSIGVERYDGPCEEVCSRIDESYNDYIKGSLKDGVTYIQRDLMPESRYCVFVNLAANKDSFENFKRKCVDARTGNAPEKSFGIVLTAALIPVGFIIAIIGLLICICQYKRGKGKFGENKIVVPHPPDLNENGRFFSALDPLLPSAGQIQGRTNPTFSTISGFPSVSWLYPEISENFTDHLPEDANRGRVPTSGPAFAVTIDPEEMGCNNGPDTSVTSSHSSQAMEDGSDNEDDSDDNQVIDCSDTEDYSQVTHDGSAGDGCQSNCHTSQQLASSHSRYPSAGQQLCSPIPSFNSRYAGARQQHWYPTQSFEEEEESEEEEGAEGEEEIGEEWEAEGEEETEEENQLGEDFEEQVAEDGENDEDTESASASAAAEFHPTERAVSSQAVPSTWGHSSPTSSTQHILSAARKSSVSTPQLQHAPLQAARKSVVFSIFDEVHAASLPGGPSIEEILQAAKGAAAGNCDGSVTGEALKVPESKIDVPVSISAKFEHARQHSAEGHNASPAVHAGSVDPPLVGASLDPAGLETVGKEDFINVEDTPQAAENCHKASATGTTAAGGGDGMASAGRRDTNQPVAAKYPFMQERGLPDSTEEPCQPTATSATSLSESSKELISSVDNILRAAEGCPWKSDVSSKSDLYSAKKEVESTSEMNSSSNRDSLHLSTSSAESGFKSDSIKETDSEPELPGKSKKYCGSAGTNAEHLKASPKVDIGSMPDAIPGLESDGEAVIEAIRQDKTETKAVHNVHPGYKPELTRVEACVSQDRPDSCSVVCHLNSLTTVKTPPMDEQQAFLEQASDKMPLVDRFVSDVHDSDKHESSEDSMFVSESTQFLSMSKDRSKQRERFKECGPHRRSTYYKVTKEGHTES